MRKCLLAGVLAVTGMLCVADFANAQLFRRGRAMNYGSGYYGPGYYDGNYGYYSNNNPNTGNAWNNNGYRSFYYNDGDQFNQQDNRFRDDLRPDTRQDQAFITVRVPASDAQVWFDDHRTQQGGVQRLFESPPLQSGTYIYEIRAKWRNQGGKDMNQTRTVRVQRGQRVTVDFNRSGTQQGERLDNPRRGNQPNQPNRNQADENQRQGNRQNPDQPQQNKNPPQQDR
jgi:uncharacterized protein (TIGR03000 family)